MAKVIRLNENDVERLVKKIIKEEQKPGPGTHGSRGIHLDDDTIELIESGEIDLPMKYTIEDYTLWVDEDDYDRAKDMLGYGMRL